MAVKGLIGGLAPFSIWYGIVGSIGGCGEGLQRWEVHCTLAGIEGLDADDVRSLKSRSVAVDLREQQITRGSS